MQETRRLVLGVPTLNRYDLLAKLLASVEIGTRRPDLYIVVDNGGKIEEHIRSGLRVPRPNLILSPGENVGVACAWNLILDKSPGSFVILANDDVEVERNTIAVMTWAAATSPHLLIACSNLNAWAFCLQKPELAASLGYYDENCWPANIEDMDMCFRMLRTSLQIYHVPSAQARHVGQATTKADAELSRRIREEFFVSNVRYFREKWPGINVRTLAGDRRVVPFLGRPPTGWSERPITARLRGKIREWSA